MNIFFLDPDPAVAAKFHNDRHVVKMILESAQMLSTACRESGLNEGYKPCFQHHPCTQWASERFGNWNWLRRLALELNEEFKYRYDNEDDHKSAVVVRQLPEPPLPGGRTKPAMAMPDYCKTENPIEAYRKYYREEKDHLAEWTGRPVPNWYNQ
jgi:hypothetical protein